MKTRTSFLNYASCVFISMWKTSCYWSRLFAKNAESKMNAFGIEQNNINRDSDVISWKKNIFVRYFISFFFLLFFILSIIHTVISFLLLLYSLFLFFYFWLCLFSFDFTLFRARARIDQLNFSVISMNGVHLMNGFTFVINNTDSIHVSVVFARTKIIHLFK